MPVELTTAVNDLFVLLCAVLVFAMHVGFSMLEAGSCQTKNRASILIKNVLVVAIAGLAWWAVGYLLATGVHMERKSNPGFIGTSAADLETSAFLKDVNKTGEFESLDCLCLGTATGVFDRESLCLSAVQGPTTSSGSLGLR